MFPEAVSALFAPGLASASDGAVIARGIRVIRECISCTLFLKNACAFLRAPVRSLDTKRIKLRAYAFDPVSRKMSSLLSALFAPRLSVTTVHLLHAWLLHHECIICTLLCSGERRVHLLHLVSPAVVHLLHPRLGDDNECISCTLSVVGGR